MSSCTQPSETNDTPENDAVTTLPSAALTMVSRSASVLLLTFGFRMKSAPGVGAKLSLLSTRKAMAGSSVTPPGVVKVMRDRKLSVESVSTSRSNCNVLTSPPLTKFTCSR